MFFGESDYGMLQQQYIRHFHIRSDNYNSNFNLSKKTISFFSNFRYFFEMIKYLNQKII